MEAALLPRRDAMLTERACFQGALARWILSQMAADIVMGGHDRCDAIVTDKGLRVIIKHRFIIYAGIYVPLNR